jgi:hypothetical protein
MPNVYYEVNSRLDARILVKLLIIPMNCFTMNERAMRRAKRRAAKKQCSTNKNKTKFI